MQRLRTLPAKVHLSDLQSAAPEGPPAGQAHGHRASNLLLGVADNDLLPVRLDLWGADPHLIIYGDTDSGKTTLLRVLLSQLLSDTGRAGSGLTDRIAAGSATARIVADRLVADRVVVVDYRRSLLADPTPAVRLARTAAQASAAVAEIVAELSVRLAGPVPAAADADGRHGGRITDGTPTGAQPGAEAQPGTDALSSSDDRLPTTPRRIYLLVDDYDMVHHPAANPLAALLPFLAHGRDVGFHLVLARRTGGAARAQYEPFLQTLGDLGTPVLVFSGPPAEGRLSHGVVPQRLPAGRARLAGRTQAPDHAADRVHRRPAGAARPLGRTAAGHRRVRSAGSCNRLLGMTFQQPAPPVRR